MTSANGGMAAHRYTPQVTQRWPRGLTAIYRYFGRNPAEGSDFISNGFVASAIFILYTRKINPTFSDFQNPIFDFDLATLDLVFLEWSYSYFPYA